MKYLDAIISGITFIAVVFAILYFSSAQPSPTAGSATSLCDVTQTKVNIGNQLTMVVLAAGSYQWAEIDQPLNATNTVYLGINAPAVSGNGTFLTPATTSSPVPSKIFGFAVDRPYRGAIQAITSTGSSTVNVLSCK